MYDSSNIGGSSQLNISGSSSPHPHMSPIHSFSVDDLSMGEPQFSLSMPNTVGDDSPVEEVPPLKKKPSKICQKRTYKNDDEVRNISWTSEEEIAL
ncbi:hypothetical protein Tco_0799008 [Tanacetum coccineum]